MNATINVQLQYMIMYWLLGLIYGCTLKCVCACDNVLSTPTDLLFPMELIKVLTALEPVVGGWYMLGLHLGLSDTVVDTIERDYHTTPERKKRMVQRWMSAPQLCPSWCSLVQALRKVSLNTAAEKISKKYSKCFVDILFHILQRI